MKARSCQSLKAFDCFFPQLVILVWVFGVRIVQLPYALDLQLCHQWNGCFRAQFTLAWSFSKRPLVHATVEVAAVKTIAILFLRITGKLGWSFPLPWWRLVARWCNPAIIPTSHDCHDVVYAEFALGSGFPPGLWWSLAPERSWRLSKNKKSRSPLSLQAGWYHIMLVCFRHPEKPRITTYYTDVLIILFCFR